MEKDKPKKCAKWRRETHSFKGSSNCVFYGNTFLRPARSNDYRPDRFSAADRLSLADWVSGKYKHASCLGCQRCCHLWITHTNQSLLLLRVSEAPYQRGSPCTQNNKDNLTVVGFLMRYAGWRLGSCCVWEFYIHTTLFSLFQYSYSLSQWDQTHIHALRYCIGCKPYHWRRN